MKDACIVAARGVLFVCFLFWFCAQNGDYVPGKQKVTARGFEPGTFFGSRVRNRSQSSTNWATATSRRVALHPKKRHSKSTPGYGVWPSQKLLNSKSNEKVNGGGGGGGGGESATLVILIVIIVITRAPGGRPSR